MTPTDFKEWRIIMGFTVDRAAKELGIVRSTVNLYEHGRRYDNPDVEVVIPLVIDLACRYICFRDLGALPEFTGDTK